MVYYLSEKQEEFSSVYLNVREKENRIYTDEETAMLPYINESHRHYREWLIRMNSCNRFLKYLSGKNPEELLEVGCGNGWFSYRLARATLGRVTGLDMNERELEQADRVFQGKNLRYVYADIFADVMPENYFNLIIFNSSIQYFPDFEQLKERVFRLLAKNGEFHILDSPFYKADRIEHARERTLQYYQSLGYPEMAKHYYHHTVDQLRGFEVMYKPAKFIGKLFKASDSPFMWVKTVKKQAI